MFVASNVPIASTYACRSVWLRSAEPLVKTFYGATEVVMSDCSDAEVQTYVDSGEPMDKVLP